MNFILIALFAAVASVFFAEFLFWMTDVVTNFVKRNFDLEHYTNKD